MIHVFTDVDGHYFCRAIPIDLPPPDTILELKVGNRFRTFRVEKSGKHRWSEKTRSWFVSLDWISGQMVITGNDLNEFRRNWNRATSDGTLTSTPK